MTTNNTTLLPIIFEGHAIKEIFLYFIAFPDYKSCYKLTSLHITVNFKTLVRFTHFLKFFQKYIQILILVKLSMK